jgi:hypothetical protein
VHVTCVELLMNFNFETKMGKTPVLAYHFALSLRRHRHSSGRYYLNCYELHESGRYYLNCYELHALLLMRNEGTDCCSLAVLFPLRLYACCSVISCPRWNLYAACRFELPWNVGRKIWCILRPVFLLPGR